MEVVEGVNWNLGEWLTRRLRSRINGEGSYWEIHFISRILGEMIASKPEGLW